MHPFVESDYTGSYLTSLRAPVNGLWNGSMSRDEFREAFELAIDVGIRKAWKDGLEKAGIAWDERTEEDESALSAFILEQFSFIDGFADFIEANSKANKGKLASLQYRLSMWANGYNKAIAKAFALAKGNPLVSWKRNPQKDSCRDCVYADGKVYRKSVWIRWGWTPGDSKLACHGIQCGCEWADVPAGTRANKGHPRRPLGPE